MSRRLAVVLSTALVAVGCGLSSLSSGDGVLERARPLTELDGDYQLQIDQNERLVISGMRGFHQGAASCLAASGLGCLTGNLAAALGESAVVSAADAGTIRSIDDRLGGGQVTGKKWGYAFHLVVRKLPDGGFEWGMDSDPVVYQRTGIRSFYIDETGILLGGDVGGASDGGTQMPEI